MQIDDPSLLQRLRRFLPSALMAKLADDLQSPDAGRELDREVAREAINHLGGLTSAVKSFLPAYLADDDALLAANDYSRLRPGAFLFADVSGFTALSEKIQQRAGSEGAEVLTAVIIDYFSTMLEILANSNGQLLKFAGDALLAFFPVNKEDDLTEASARAVRTGLRMQRAMAGKFQPVKSEALIRLLGETHDSSLTMSIGIAQGKLYEALVGNTRQRDHIIQGDLPGLAMEAEGVGTRDEVIIDNAQAEALGGQFEFTPMDEQFQQVLRVRGGELDDYEFSMLGRRRAKPTALFDLEQSSLLESLGRQLATVETVSRYLAPNVLSELVASDDFHLQSENRPTVTMFTHVTGFAELLALWGEEHLDTITKLLNRYYNIVQGIVSGYEGTLARTDPYKLGSKLLVTFGAPIAHADDPARAVAAALEMMRQNRAFNTRLLEELPRALAERLPPDTTMLIQQRIGITQGDIFAGEVGWKQRREFTVMGDDVNLSARLMAYAQPGQIVISQRVQDATDGAFQTQAVEPITLKGKRRPVNIFLVLDDAAPVAVRFDDDTPFIGHDMFMLSLKLSLQQATRRRRRAAALIGDAGIGKTRIAGQLARDALSSGFRVAWTSGTSRNNPRTTWASVVRQLLPLERSTPATDGQNGQNGQGERQQLRERLRALGMGDLEGVLSELLFGITAPHLQSAKVGVRSASTLTVPPQTPDTQETNTDKKRTTDMFAQLNNLPREQMMRSGMFGSLRRATGQTGPLDNDQGRAASSAPANAFANPAAGETIAAATAGNGTSVETVQAVEQPPTPGAKPQTGTLYQNMQRRVNMEDAIARFLKAVTDDTPALVVFDDVHQENDEALKILRHVLANVTQARLILLATYEPSGGFALDMQPLIVPDLSEDETIQIAMMRLHVHELDPDLSHLLWSRTSGRPLFVESLLRTLHEGEFITIENGRAALKPDANLDAIPSDVRTLVISQIDRLNDPAQLAVRAAAIFDEAMSAAELAAIIDIEPGVLNTALEELCGAQILQEDRAAGSRVYHFRHGLTRAVIYDTLSRAQRVKLHRATAAYFQSVAKQAEIAVEAVVEAIKSAAYHLTRCGLLPTAVDYLQAQSERLEQAPFRNLEAALDIINYALSLLPGDSGLLVRREELIGASAYAAAPATA